jgi:hypothetical protein
MSIPLPHDEHIDPAAASIVGKVRWLMLISGATTLVAIAAVVGVIGYRVFHAEGSVPALAEVAVALPKGAKVVAITAAQDRIVATVDIGGALEARTFDLVTLRPTGRLTFTTQP